MSTCIEIYTDGSCHTQHRAGAWASVLLHNGNRIELSGECPDTTHNRMELIAVIHSIQYADDNNMVDPIVVYTDSQYATRIPERKEKIKQKNYRTNKGTMMQNADLVQMLINQIETHDIRFVKVKAHQKSSDSSTILNNEVDILARKLVRKQVQLENESNTKPTVDLP